MMELWPFTNFHDLNLDWIIKTIKTYTKKVDDLYNFGLYDYVEEVLAAHPEWTTTVMDGAIGTAKLMDDSVTIEKLAENMTEYLDVETRTIKYSGTGSATCYYAIIPATNKPFLKLANDVVNDPEDAAKIAGDARASIAINGGMFDTNTGMPYGFVIADEIVYSSTPWSHTGNDILYMTEDGELHTAVSTTPLATLQTYNPVWAVQGFYGIMKNGVNMAVTYDDNQIAPRSVIAQDTVGNYLVMSAGARDIDNEGLSIPDIIGAVAAAGFSAVTIYVLDGGRSSALIEKNIRVNPVCEGYTRDVPNMICFKAPETPMIDQFEDMPIMSKTFNTYQKWVYDRIGRHQYIADVNNALEGVYQVGPTTANSPLPADSYGFVIAYRDIANLTVQVVYNQSHMYTREIYQGTPGTWIEFYNTVNIDQACVLVDRTDFITMNTGYEIVTGQIYKTGKHYFGNLVIKKTDGYFSGSEVVGTLVHHPRAAVNYGAFFSDSEWGTQAIGYLYCSAYGVQVQTDTANKNYVKIQFDYKSY